MIIPDTHLRERFEAQRTADHYGSLEPFAYASIMGAYTEEGLDWKNQLVACVDKNRHLVQDYFRRPSSPGYVFPVEGTYVCWIRWDGLAYAGKDLKDFLAGKAYVSLEAGTEFGESYGHYTRMNLSSTKEQTRMAVKRLEQLFESCRQVMNAAE
ncbi:MAG: hypothetical protein LUF30_08655 [Lachnospiraceae bacterium]|nr:hypothetical protein [Lachnospiraceae bacterium]